MYNYGYDYTATADSLSNTGMMAAFMGFFTTYFIFILIICVISVIATWKIFVKAGKPGWAAIIPFYNSVVLCQIAGVNPWWVLIVCGSSILLSAVPVLGLVSAVASIYFMILLNVSIARSFGKEDGFAVGLILLAPIFYMVLGCGKSEYVGAKPMNDFLFKNNNTNTQNATVTPSVDNSQSSVKYCAGCGTQVDQTTKFCPKCGQEVK